MSRTSKWKKPTPEQLRARSIYRDFRIYLGLGRDRTEARRQLTKTYGMSYAEIAVCIETAKRENLWKE